MRSSTAQLHLFPLPPPGRPSSSPTSLALTARDRTILAAVADYHFLTREQVQRLFFGEQSPYSKFRRPGTAANGYRRACARLRQLSDAGLLQRLIGPRDRYGLIEDAAAAASHFTRPPYLYVLTARGASLITLPAGRKVRDLLAARVRTLRPATLAHELTLSDVRILVTLHAAGAPGWELLAWHDTRAAYDAYLDRGKRQVLSPDAYAHFRANDQDIVTFIEVDRGTEGLARIREKLAAYRRYSRSKRFEAKYGLRKFRVAFVTTQTPARATNLVAEASHEAPGLVWATTRQQLLTAADPFADAIWLRAGRPQPAPFWVAGAETPLDTDSAAAATMESVPTPTRP
jgi:hypothetical protein